jgi:cell division protein FtsI (penicillin-binding protein 3)
VNDVPPPSPHSAPQGRPESFGAFESSPSRALVRVNATEAHGRGRIRNRLVVAACGFGVLFTAVAIKLTDATVLDPAASRIATASRRVQPEQPVSRAEITDRNGEVLAVSVRGTALYARPPQIDNPVLVADRLLRILPHLDRERLVARLSPPRAFAYIDRFITPRQEQAINDLGILGLHFETAERRTYPRGRDASHVLGVMDVDGVGIAGVEKWYDERLRVSREPLRLSLDIRIQRELREALGEAIERFSGIGGAAILMDVNTAEVLGMVSLPDFAAADLAGAPAEQRFNRAVTGVYEPGSTFKLVTSAMALELGTVNLSSGFDASRPIRFGRFTINDFRGKNRWLSLPEIIAYSSNLGTAHMAMTVGPTRHREFMVRMGLLSRQTIELPEAAVPLAPTRAAWREINTMTIGFGHGIAVTPMHVIASTAALANGGLLRQPTVLALPPGAEREGTRVISERTSEQMRRLMRVAVTDGSARGADAPGYFVGGKTGTAQKLSEHGRYIENKRVSAFVGAFPINAPRYAIYLMVDEPKPRADSGPYATAGVVAAPVARRVVERVAPILGMVPELDRIAQIQQTIALPLNGRIAPRPTPAAQTGAAPVQPRPSAPVTRPLLPPQADTPAATIRRTDASPGAGEIGMPRMVLHSLPPEAGRVPR